MTPDARKVINRSIPIPFSGCLVFEGPVTNGGYGRSASGGVTRLAHRIVYESVNGPVPDGMELDHLCRVRSCVNPDHLEAVTRRENMRRSPIACRALQPFADAEKARTHCPKGHLYNAANTYWTKKGTRHCKPCTVQATRDFRQKKRDADLVMKGINQ